MEEALQSNLAAIVFTDIVGFSRMMSEDEASALPRAKAELARLKELCEKHHGKVLKSTGDGLLMHFTSAVKAVACALEIQRSATSEGEHPLKHRIGIHLGDVYLEDGDVMGDGVNIAARLQTQADSGGICISKTVYDVVKNRLAIQATFLGPRELKNITEAVPIYKILIEAQGRSTIVHPERPKSKSRPSLALPVALGIALVVVVLVTVIVWHETAKSPIVMATANNVPAATSAAAQPAAPLSATATRVVGAWQSLQRRSIVVYLPDGRFGINLSFGDRKILGIVGTWKADGDTITVVRTDPPKTMVSHIINLSDAQMILRGDSGIRFLERIPMPDLPTVMISGLTGSSIKDPNRPQLKPVTVMVPADQSYNLGVADFNNGDYDLAIGKFTEAFALKPDFYQARFHRAQSYELSNAFDKAIADYGELIKVHPKDPFYFHNRGIAGLKSGDYHSALNDENTALAIKPDFSNALISRGEAYILLGQYPEAITDFTAAIVIEPNSINAYADRGVAKKASGDALGGQADLDHADALLATPPSAPTPTPATNL